VVELLRVGGSVVDLAGAVADATEIELDRAKGDPGLGYTTWLLTQLPLAARMPNFSARLGELGFERGAEQSVFSLVASFSKAVDRNLADRDRTDLGELARQASTESLFSFVASGAPSLFGSTADDVQRELAHLATKERFSGLARDFFARLTFKILEYYISRELPKHVGPTKAIASIDGQITFRLALEKHCHEASAIVQEFVGGWFSKSNWQGTLSPTTAQNFADYALKKLRDELRARRADDA
jgi:hypothetical protein